ncbi:unnamed protein product, partial [Phaeothamnion confervicola]
MPQRETPQQDYGLRQRRGGGGGDSASTPIFGKGSGLGGGGGGAFSASGASAGPPLLAPALPGPRLDDPWAEWVMVYGFHAAAASEVFRRFQGLGSVVEQRAGPGNWLFLRYATPLQADKVAAAGPYAMLSDHIMLGVQKLDDRTARRVGMTLADNGSVLLGGAAGTGAIPTDRTAWIPQPHGAAGNGVGGGFEG